jgi:hypothetical protein
MQKLLLLTLLLCNQVYGAQAASKQGSSHTNAKKKLMACVAYIPKFQITVVNMPSPIRMKPNEPEYLYLIESNDQLKAKIELVTPGNTFSQYVEVIPLHEKFLKAAKQAVLERIKRKPSSQSLRTFMLYDDKTMEEFEIQSAK